jgi:hypothetical protein
MQCRQPSRRQADAVVGRGGAVKCRAHGVQQRLLGRQGMLHQDSQLGVVRQWLGQARAVGPRQRCRPQRAHRFERRASLIAAVHLGHHKPGSAIARRVLERTLQRAAVALHVAHDRWTAGPQPRVQPALEQPARRVRIGQQLQCRQVCLSRRAPHGQSQLGQVDACSRLGRAWRVEPSPQQHILRAIDRHAVGHRPATLLQPRPQRFTAPHRQLQRLRQRRADDLGPTNERQPVRQRRDHAPKRTPVQR